MASASPRTSNSVPSSSLHFAAGLGSGIMSAVLLQPADLLKTRVQQSRSTGLAQTIRAIAAGPAPLRHFWRGTLPSTLRTGIGSALYFSSLNALRTRLASPLAPAGSGPRTSSLPKLSNAANLGAGAAARASVGLVMMPVTVLKVRYESSLYAYRSLRSAAAHILRTEGPRGFFAGFGATAARDAPYAGLYVLFYERLKTHLSFLSSPAAVHFSSGALAAGAATALTNPFDAVKTRLQLMPARYGNMVAAARLVVREEGARALLDGLGLRMARKALSSALAWTVYEELVRRMRV
ncbi:MAG: hypothetical protein M1832_004920 [Thelocarpon impressellum]|nr:MAG: hypothetical protein M1832_004920 [Thelocarpon impressellum]